MSRPSICAMLSVAIAVPALAAEIQTRTPTQAVFAKGAPPTGWVNFDLFNGNRMFIRAKVNGRDTVVTLSTNDPLSHMDKRLATSIGLLADASAVDSGV